MFIRIFIVFTSLLLAACANMGSISKVQLERTPCARGACPAYSVEVSRDGSVKYVGSSNVKINGDASGSISAADWQLLQTAVKSARFYSMEAHYPSSSSGCTTVVNHHPTIKITVTRKRSTKQVSYNTGCWGNPEGKLLTWLANTTDMVTNSTKWVHEHIEDAF